MPSPGCADFVEIAFSSLNGTFVPAGTVSAPGLLVGGPASDRFGRRPVVWPFVALSPLATLLLVLGPRSLALIAAAKAQGRQVELVSAAHQDLLDQACGDAGD